MFRRQKHWEDPGSGWAALNAMSVFNFLRRHGLLHNMENYSPPATSLVLLMKHHMKAF